VLGSLALGNGEEEGGADSGICAWIRLKRTNFEVFARSIRAVMPGKFAKLFF
jgi:hypothetical protein